MCSRLTFSLAILKLFSSLACIILTLEILAAKESISPQNSHNISFESTMSFLEITKQLSTRLIIDKACISVRDLFEEL